MPAQEIGIISSARILSHCIQILIILLVLSGNSVAEKLNVSQIDITVTGDGAKELFNLCEPSCLVDGYGAEPYPVTGHAWNVRNTPTPDKPAVAVFDYTRSVKVSALAHFFYVPGCRDFCMPEMWRQGPCAFGELNIYVSHDKQNWIKVSHHKNIPLECPQLFIIQNPTEARYLKLEVLSLSPHATLLKSYEIETYINTVPDKVVCDPQMGKAVSHNFPNKTAIQPVTKEQSGTWKLHSPDTIDITMPASSDISVVEGWIRVEINDTPVCWNSLDSEGKAVGHVTASTLEMNLQFVQAGLLAQFNWNGSTSPEYPNLKVITGLQNKPTVWCIPGYTLQTETLAEDISIPSVKVGTSMVMIGNQKHYIGLIPNDDRSFIGAGQDYASAAFALYGQSPKVLIMPSSGNWQNCFRKAIVDVFDFTEPRQFSPVSKIVPDFCRFLLSDDLWSAKYQMIRSFPGRDFFYIFYSLPYCVPALSYWGAMTGNNDVHKKVDAILQFTLSLRIKDGPMKGAIFSQYADRELCDNGEVPYGYPPFYTWYKDIADAPLVGMDQGNNRWITSHTMGSVLWAITDVWHHRGQLPEDIITSARDVADWMVRFMREDGSWAYSYHPDGKIALSESGSGTIWNVWALHRFAELTDQDKYKQAADKAREYFLNTFTKNHLYRGYWEDSYHGEKAAESTLNTAQSYESSIAAIAFAEMGLTDAAASSSLDSLRYVCTRTLACRTYFTSYGGVCESYGWAPGTYISPTFGRGAQLAWMQTNDDFYKRFASLGKTSGWWHDRETGGSFWLGEAITFNPIEMYQQSGGNRQFWALWDTAQKVTFLVPWLIDEINSRKAEKLHISTINLQGTDDLGRPVQAKHFNGEVKSDDNQVNWLGLMPVQEKGGFELVLLNHSTQTEVNIKPNLSFLSVSGRIYNTPEKHLRKPNIKINERQITVMLPEGAIAVLSFKIHD